jgi:hypothetical protein
MKKNITLGTIVLLSIVYCFFTPLQLDADNSISAIKVNSSILNHIQLAQQGTFQYQETLNMKPPFYEGSMPLVYISEKKAIGMSEMITVSRDYGDFKNNFSYNDAAMKYSGIADGARTSDPAGRLLAEASLIKLIKGEGIQIEEKHYGSDGKVIFRCISLIEFGLMGFKKEEMEIEGKKQRDYYFLWPVSTH